MKNLLVWLLCALAAALAGCSPVPIKTDAASIDVEPALTSQLRAGQAVELKNFYGAESVVVFMKASPGWSTDRKELTQTAVTVLGRALQKQGLKVASESGKVITLRVVDVAGGFMRVAFVQEVRIRLQLEARFGDGTVAIIDADHQETNTGGVQSVLDGALLVALKELVRHERFVAYVNG